MVARAAPLRRITRSPAPISSSTSRAERARAASSERATARSENTIFTSDNKRFGGRPSSGSAVGALGCDRMPAGGLHLLPGFVAPQERAGLLRWLESIHPLWEERYAARGGTAAPRARRLLRPVYWLGNWQFACLDYYRPPRDVRDRCVAAEPYPAVLAKLVARVEELVRSRYAGRDLPERWHLNTCLVNLYGSRVEAGAQRDCARVGEHRDFEPGPVASLSFGERALFQFVKRGARDAPTL